MDFRPFSNMYASADMMAEHGIVRIHAQIIRPAIPHFTALMRLMDPTPIIDPVMVWVVLTGMPKADDANKVTAAPDSAQNPSTGLSLATFWPMVFTMRQPPSIVPNAIEAWHIITIQKGI